MSFFIDNVDFDSLSFGYDDQFEKIVSVVKEDFLSLKKINSTSNRALDRRFNTTYRGHCAYSWTAFCLKPTDYKLIEITKRTLLILRPFPHIVDTLINASIFCFETVKVVDNFVLDVARISLFALPKLQEKLQFVKHKTAFVNSLGLSIYSFFSIFSDIIGVPGYWIGLFTIGLNHSYWVFDKNKNAFVIVLDQNKVSWLKEKYGYNPLDQRLVELDKPWNSYKGEVKNGSIRTSGGVDNHKIECEIKEINGVTHLDTTLTWIEWKYLWTMVLPYGNSISYFSAENRSLNNSVRID